MPSSFPSLDVVGMEEVKQDGRPLHQGAKKNVRAERVALLINSRIESAMLSACAMTWHAMPWWSEKDATVGDRRSHGVLLHRSANELIKVEDELTTQVWFVAGREYNWNRLGLQIIDFMVALTGIEPVFKP